MACISCNVEMCYACYNPDDNDDCCCGGKFYQEPNPFLDAMEDEPVPKFEVPVVPKFEVPEPTLFDDPEPVRQEKPKPAPKHRISLEKKRPVGRPRMNPEEMTDALRAGRNRAGRQVPIEDNKICSWAGLKYAGGGIRPIIGCIGLPVGARHHGPDKSTVNNEIGVNLHLICHTCHNRWHAENNRFYGARPTDGSPFVPRDDAGENRPHDPDTKATTTDLFTNEMYWNTPINKRSVETTETDEENLDLTENVVYGTMELDTEEGKQVDSQGIDRASANI